MYLDSWFAWRLALDNIEQSQSSCVIIGLGQERYAARPIVIFHCKSLFLTRCKDDRNSKKELIKFLKYLYIKTLIA